MYARTAGFLALGMAKVGPPAAVMCTSGSAVANLHPAGLEAAHAGVALVVVTADRPASVRGTGASQTTDQVRIFGEAADFFDIATEEDFDAAQEALADLAALGRGRPLHINIPFTPPLVPDPPWERRFDPTDETAAEPPPSPARRR